MVIPLLEPIDMAGKTITADAKALGLVARELLKDCRGQSETGRNLTI
jgi:hypothetical protein